ncbi:hypothetical protein CEB3_c49520 [Peptococcaceae bacterium CEB3]|nr:hypothetical protein CEB3_c49520 [Peptococcaceae bacterium CEB3]
MDVKVKHIKGMHFQAEGNSKAVTHLDTSTVAGGSGMGASPMEMVLMATAGCSGMDVVSILGKMRIKYTRFEVAVHGDRAAEHPRVFTDVELVYKFWGDGLAQDKLERAVTLSLNKYCSVANMIDKAANLTYRIEVNPE